MKELADILRNKGLKVTPQRLAIFQTLEGDRKHPSAEMIYNVLKKSFPSMSLATVYKTLDSFKKSNLIQELSVGGDSFRYDAITCSHPHFFCIECKEVTDLNVDINVSSIIKNQLSDKIDCEILYEKLYFYGHCSYCKSRKNLSETNSV